MKNTVERMIDMKNIKRVLIMLCAVALLMTSFAFAESHVHSYGDWVTTKQATCGSAGSKQRICSDCGNVEKETIQPTGNHSYGEWVTTKEATCGAAGSKQRICSGCGNVEKETIQATGNHSYGEWVTTKEATCGAAGSKQRICSGCGNVEKETIQPTGEHSYGEWTTTTEATCATEGQKMRICSGCGNVEKETIQPTGEHSYGEWTTTKEATCSAKGEKMRICSGCGNVEKGEIPTIAHTYETETIAPTKTSKGYTLHTCSVCGHSYKDNWKAKTGSNSSKKTTTAAKPAATEAPEKDYGSIVTDADNVELEYTDTTDETVLEIVAPAEADGSYAVRKLHLTPELISQLKEEGIETIRFTDGEVTVEFAIDVFEAENVQLIAADLAQDVSEYVVTIDPAAETAAMVTETIVTADAAETDITEFVSGIQLSVNGTIVEAGK